MAEIPEDDGPIYVRVEGYKNVLKNLEAIKQILDNMEYSLKVIRRVEEVKEKSIDTFLESVENLEDKLTNMGDEFPNVGSLGGYDQIQAEKSEKDGRRSRRRPRRVLNEEEFDRSERSQEPVPGADEEVIEDSMNELHEELKSLKDELNNL